ncbi:TPA: restriction endonuclease subunit S [Pseudomonas aeruginosa]|uniref:restriction endonuclease subunit S n=1 Tax=Pseudomonas aeruginosa TaxID=287 RepID=UPI003D9C566E|nr:restriction endonuclease subunit S [Pseudomonas aeruginosa]
MKEKKDEHPTMKPRLRFPTFRESGEWREVSLAKFLKESRIEGSSGDIARKITVKLWGNGVYAKEESIKGSENTKYYKRRAGQFIYSKLDFLNQAFGIVPPELEGYESTVDLPCFDVSKDINTSFLLEWVKRDDFYKRNGEIADGGRKAKRIQSDVFLSFSIALPPHITEQNKIADCLTSLDDLIAAENKKLNSIKAHKIGLMQQIFPQEGETLPALRFPDFADSEVPAAKMIGEISKVTTGRKDTQNKVENGQYPFFVRSQSVARIDTYSYDGEAILTSGDGVGVGENYHYVNGKFDFHQRVYCIYDFNKCAHGKFLYYQFSARFKKRVKTMSAKNSVDSVRMAMITEMPIWLPGIDEQKRIANFLSTIDNVINAQALRIQSLNSHKVSLVQTLFPSTREVDA